MNKIYTITKETKEYRYDEDDYDSWGEATALRIFTEAGKLGTEICQEIEGCFIIHDYDYNNLGDCWKVEPSYEMGCRYYDTLKSKAFKELLYAYSIDCFPLPELNLDDWDTDHQKQAQDLLPDMEDYYNSVMTQIKERLPTSGFTIVDASYSGYGERIRTYTLKIVDLDNEFFNAPKVIVNETTQDKQWRERDEYYASEQYKIDCKENAERQREISTIMGENGWHNMCMDDDGTIRMW